MGTVISELFEESGMSVQAFADKAGLKYGTAYDIAKGVSKVENIGAGAFVRIAHVFGKTADELLSDIPNRNEESTLSSDESLLVKYYREMDSFSKEFLLKKAESLKNVFPESASSHQISLHWTRDMSHDEFVDEVRLFYNRCKEEGLNDEQIESVLNGATEIMIQTPVKNTIGLRGDES